MASSGESAGALEEASKPTGTYIREVILENFMSHEYSRITLSPGLNVITGPNGSGKSSILLGISVALGQTYTDRAGKLSDLIRRGEKAARLTVIFDNAEVDGRRPIPWLQSDQLVITRYLKRTGEYWHYVNNRLKTKAEVDHLLRRLGINPNNMLIIMHQNMIEEFASKNNVEKLKMVEDAVG
ncbi:MAG: AAA family ATPase, partial [Nitrososphaerota archaeon]